jgi:hypothetical protein
MKPSPYKSKSPDKRPNESLCEVIAGYDDVCCGALNGAVVSLVGSGMNAGP